MCGLVGVVWKSGEQRPLVQAMTRRLAHRGPDEERFWFAPELALGFRRLSIIDPEHGQQPLTDASGQVVVACNGMIYNHVEHRRRLETAGICLTSGSDAAVIPDLYRQTGIEVLDQLDGKFALALYDADRQRLLLARDRLGIKPLYYLDTPSGFWFASEMKCLLLVPDFSPAVDREALDLLLALKHIPGDRTLLDGVRMLPPGSRLVYDLSEHSFTIEAFYRTPVAPSATPAGEACLEVQRLFDRAVAKRLMSDVPLGIALSGGLDSSAVCASVAHLTGRPPRTFSVYVGDRVNELHFARLVAEQYHTDHEEIVVTPDALPAVIPLVLWHLEEPLSISELPTYYLGQAIGKRLKVVLCGEGADELFGGYKRFGLISLAPRQPPSLLAWAYIRGLNGLGTRERQHLYAPAQRPYRSPNATGWWRHMMAEEREPVMNRLLRYELRYQLRSQVMRLDKLTMAHGVEARCPFLDRELVDYVANLPPSLKVRGRREKILLKAAMASRLPREIIERRKFGMSNPVTTLFRGPFRDVCFQELAAGRDVLDQYFEWSAIASLFREVGRYPVWLKIPEQNLFHIYLFLHWHRLFIDGQLPAAVRQRELAVGTEPESAVGSPQPDRPRASREAQP